MTKLYKVLRRWVNNRYIFNGWIPIKTPPRRGHLGNFLVIVKRDDNPSFKYSIWMSSYSEFVKSGNSFDCWQKNGTNNYRSCSPIPKDMVVYWRPLPKLPEKIRRNSWEGYCEDPTEFLESQ